MARDFHDPMKEQVKLDFDYMPFAHIVTRYFKRNEKFRSPQDHPKIG